MKRKLAIIIIILSVICGNMVQSNQKSDLAKNDDGEIKLHQIDGNII